MTDHRKSYRKTVTVALVVTGLAVLLGLAAIVWPGAPGSGWLMIILVSPPALAIAALAGCVAAGGLIGLHRDAREALGQPYYSTRPREQAPGLLTHLLRRVRTLMGGSPARLHLRPGEWVRVRPFAEISATLDQAGQLDGLPFMPEMLPICGQRHRVFRRVEKIHDYLNPAGAHLRRMRDAVMLDDLRCGGERHGFCQAGCQFIWKEAWLEPADSADPDGHDLPAADAARLDAFLSMVTPEGETRYICQMTRLPEATTRLKWKDPRHYLRDLCSGNIRFSLFMTAVCITLFNEVQRRTGGPRAPYRQAADGKPAPTEALDLQPGDMVRVRTKREIEQTLNAGSRNRGLWFDIEMHRFCGGEFRVATRVRNIVDELNGNMLTMGNPCIVLEGVTATGEYLGLCPQNELIYWREAWLERISPVPSASAPEQMLSDH